MGKDDPKRSEDPMAAAGTPLAGIATAHENSDKPMTSAQADQLAALCQEKGEPFDETLSEEAAAARIEELKGEDRGPTKAQS